MPDPIRAAIYQLLAGDGTLTALLATATSIYDERARQGSERPYIVFGRPSQVRTARTFGGGHVDSDLWQVKAVSEGGSASAAEAIDSRIADLLDGAELTIAGRDSLWVAREAGIRFPEDADQATLWHCGGRYRLLSHPA